MNVTPMTKPTSFASTPSRRNKVLAPLLSHPIKDDQNEDFHPVRRDQPLQQGNDGNSALLTLINEGQNKDFHPGHEAVFKSQS